MRCFAVLMAAGFSVRFRNGNKLLAPFRGKPLARHTLDLVCGMGCFERIFWVYADAAVAALSRDAIAAGFPVAAVHNPAPEKGRQESALLGIRAADACIGGDSTGPAYYAFFPCDQPLLDARTVQLLLDAARPGYITEPAARKSPSVFSAVFRDELLSLQPGEHPRLLKSRHPDLVLTVEVPNPALLADVDTSAELTRLASIQD